MVAGKLNTHRRDVKWAWKHVEVVETCAIGHTFGNTPSVLIRRLRPPTFALIATLVATGCICGAKERNIVISAPNGLALRVGGIGRPLRVPVTRLTRFHITSQAFDFLFDALEGSTRGEGVAFGVMATDPTTNEDIVISLALPVSLRPGDVYTIGTTYLVEATLNTDIRSWGEHDLVQPTKADVAFTTAVYNFPPPTYTPNFRAVTSGGTVRVIGRTDGRVELALDLMFTDATGETRSVNGVVVANTEIVNVGCA